MFSERQKVTFLAQKRSARIFGKEIRPKIFQEMDKKALIYSGRLQFPQNDRTDKNFIAQPKINLQSFKSTPDSLKMCFKAFGRKPSLGAPACL